MSSSTTPAPELVPITGDTTGALQALGLPEPVLTTWSRYRAPSQRIAFVIRDGERPLAVALTASRRLCASVKVAGIWHADPSTATAARIEQALLGEITRWAWQQGAVLVKRELAEGERPLAGSGFQPLPTPPLATGPQTPSPPAAQLCWRSQPPASDPPYMPQSTDFTCGPVALLMALSALSLRGQPDRHSELALWRQATTVMGCDPRGLAVAAGRLGATPNLTVTTDDHMLLEGLTDGERELRCFLQDEFRAQAQAAGIATRVARFSAAEVHAAVAAGQPALVLIDERLFHDEVCPHWIVAHAEHDDLLLVHDPWIETRIGESWLDGYDVPLRDHDLEQLASFGDPPYSALLTLARP